MLLARDTRADANGVYEFKSAQDFLNTIGPVAAHYKNNLTSISHYGNQMAYELLQLGYSVIYLPIVSEDCAATLIDENTWEIFKDKASYDFRFIHHGLFESTDNTFITDKQAEITAEFNSISSYIDSLVNTLQTLHNKGIIIFDKKKLTLAESTEENANSYEIIKLEKADEDGDGIPDQRVEDCYRDLEKYQELFNELIDPTEETLTDENLKNDAGDYFADLNDALRGVITKLQNAKQAEAEIQLKQDTLGSKNITTATIAAVNTNIARLAEYTTDVDNTALPGRGDCIALIELDENTYKNSTANQEIAIINAIAEAGTITENNGKFCALTVPSVVYKMAVADVKSCGTRIINPYNSNKKFPGGFHYLACFMNSLRSNFREWYAAAGYTRGVSNLTIDHTTVTLGEIAINALEPRNKGTTGLPFACNVIANFRGSYYLWGNRTAHLLGDANGNDGDLAASHFLNIRQLCTTIKKQLYVACRRFTFDPNSDTLWFNFVNAIRPTLDIMKADQGIRDYKILKVPTNQKATLKAKIRIIPIEAVEDFDLEISLEDSFGETAVTASESI